MISILSDKINLIYSLAFLVAFTGYFIWALIYHLDSKDVFHYTWCDGFGFLSLLYFFILWGYFHNYIWCPYGRKPFYKKIWNPCAQKVEKLYENWIVRWVTGLAILAAIIGYLVYDTWENLDRLISLAGLAFFLSIGYIFSNNRSKIRWRVIISGLVLQFLFGLFTLKWDIGRNIFRCAGDKVSTFLGYAQEGAAFVYGKEIVNKQAVFAFSALSTIYFLGFIINILYHLGVMQKAILALGLLLRGLMDTSICESVNSAANIFLGQSEAPLLLKPYLKHLTASELHAVMTAGFASVSGSVLAAYIHYGANPAHLITASVMAAPAGLVYSKLIFPEVEETVATEESIAMSDSEYSSVLDAACQGANQATQVVLGICANVIAFFSTVAFFNGVLSWMGNLVGYTDESELWKVEAVMGYIFMPISFLLGVKWDECQEVGQLIGLKMIVNEFAAFERFDRLNLSERSKTIATFAICGFANPGSMGIMISALGALIPNKTSVITQHVMRAFVSGSMVTFTTACIAGMLSASE